VLVIAERLGHGETLGGGLKHERQFGEVADVLGVVPCGAAACDA